MFITQTGDFLAGQFQFFFQFEPGTLQFKFSLIFEGLNMQTLLFDQGRDFVAVLLFQGGKLTFRQAGIIAIPTGINGVAPLPPLLRTRLP